MDYKTPAFASTSRGSDESWMVNTARHALSTSSCPRRRISQGISLRRLRDSRFPGLHEDELRGGRIRVSRRQAPRHNITAMSASLVILPSRRRHLRVVDRYFHMRGSDEPEPRLLTSLAHTVHFVVPFYSVMPAKAGISKIRTVRLPLSPPARGRATGVADIG